jgi:hypothetical protein
MMVTLLLWFLIQLVLWNNPYTFILHSVSLASKKLAYSAIVKLSATLCLFMAAMWYMISNKYALSMNTVEKVRQDFNRTEQAF